MQGNWQIFLFYELRLILDNKIISQVISVQNVTIEYKYIYLYTYLNLHHN